MRLIINSRQGAAAGGLRRYNGSGILGSIGRKMYSSGLKKVINIVKEQNLPQKVAGFVVDGAQSVGEELGKAAKRKLEAIVTKTQQQQQHQQQQQKLVLPLPILSPPTKRSKIDINKLISGQGIVLD